MTTTPIGSAALAPSASSSKSSPSALNTDDFVKMMLTQLQNQDPLNPTSSNDLMSEMGQIGQLQSTQQLQSTLTGLATQTQIGAASTLIGKKITGLDLNSNPASGIVGSVQVTSTGTNLQLQDGTLVSLSNVSTISAAPATGA